MNRAFIFPGQASQFVGMGKNLYAKSARFKSIIESANEIMGFDLASIMFEGPDELLTETINTQPAVFLHSYMVYQDMYDGQSPAAVAGHSLGEITALVIAGVLTFEDGLYLVKRRAEAMQKACEMNPSTMAAILGLDDDKVEEVCRSIDGVVVPANYNCPGQLVISGSNEAIALAIEKCKEVGAKRALEISVGGAFHSPLMRPAMQYFGQAVEEVKFNDAQVPVYQNVDARAHIDADEIKNNIIQQVISPVRWTHSIQNMLADNILSFVEIGGKGKILMGMVRKISREAEINLWIENE